MSVPLDARASRPKEGGPSFNLHLRLERLAFYIVWRIIEIGCPLPFHSVRRQVLRWFGAQIHPTAKIYPGVSIWYPRNLTMGKHACLATGAICYSMAPVTLGAYALVSQRAHLCAGTHDIDDPDFQLVTKEITIADHAWVAAEAFVGPGSEMETGSVLGARAVLFGKLAAWSVATGNPARTLRQRKKLCE